MRVELPRELALLKLAEFPDDHRHIRSIQILPQMLNHVGEALAIAVHALFGSGVGFARNVAISKQDFIS